MNSSFGNENSAQNLNLKHKVNALTLNFKLERYVNTNFANENKIVNCIK
jgi:hypothetical protein